MGRSLRPTSSIALNALFNIVGSVEGVDFLDLFAGTGRIGMKAFQNGAYSVVWVEKERFRVEKIRQQIKDEAKNRCLVLCMDAVRAVRYLFRIGKKFDIIFMDPPYGKGYVERLYKCIKDYNIVKRNGIVVAEYRSGEVDDSIIKKEYRYGDSALGILDV